MEFLHDHVLPPVSYMARAEKNLRRDLEAVTLLHCSRAVPAEGEAGPLAVDSQVCASGQDRENAI